MDVTQFGTVSNFTFSVVGLGDCGTARHIFFTVSSNTADIVC